MSRSAMRETWRVRFNGSINHEEDLPAEQPPPSHEARLPRPHAHPRRPRHHQSSSFQGPQDPLRLIPSDGEVERLKSHREFVAVLRHRRRVSSRDIVLHYRMRAADERAHGNVGSDVRVGLAVSKAVGNAVTRNAVKRRFRVLARRYEHELRHRIARQAECGGRAVRVTRRADGAAVPRGAYEDGSVGRPIVTLHAGQVMIRCIRWYQRRISANTPPSCRYYPSCSNYALQAIGRYGAFRGGLLAALRLLCCRPWSAGGIDDVPQRFSLFYRFSWSRAHEEPRLTPLPHDEKE